jgi:glucokinase
MMAIAREHFPWLVADIGGTNARFGLVNAPGAAVHDIVALRCAEFATPEDAAISYLERIAADTGSRLQPRLAAFAIATPVNSDTIKMTNSAWVISRRQVESALGLQRLRLLNDFEALALSAPHLTAADMTVFGEGKPDPTQAMAVIGPGTGLGVAACVPFGTAWRALAGEGGHATACAADDFESDVLSVARKKFDHVSAERLLSGIGLPLLHSAVAQVRGDPVEELAAEEITRRALAENDPGCMATLDTFCAMLGTFAGNVALTIGARGGVFVAGGIAQRLGDFFLRSRFRERFEAKGRFRGYLAPIATALITAPYAALNGAAHCIESALQMQAGALQEPTDD